MTKYFSILIILAFFSCNDQNGIFEIGGKYVDVRTNLRFIDTLMVKSYTVRIDSVRTSGLPDAILAGKYHDPEIGDVYSTSYFRVGLPGSLVVPHDAVYDSLKLIMIDNNYYNGDTISPLTLKVHRLVNTILKTRDDGYLYNTSSFPYSPETLGSVTFTPNPVRNDTVKIRLNNSFGSELFGLIKTKDDRISNSDNFFHFFNGMALTYDESDNTIMGFTSSGAFPTMRLYFHYTDFSVVSSHLDFPINSASTLQFNHFGINNPHVSGWPVKQTEKLPARAAGNVSFVEGGTGIVTRLEIPYLRNLRELYQNMQILRADLVIEPARDTYRNIKLPQNISLYSSDRLNRFVSPIIVTLTGEVLIGTLVVDNVFQEETSYTFDVTDFISSKLTEESDDVPALLVTVEPDDKNFFLFKNIDRLVLGSQSNPNNKVKLKIYYMNYE